MPAPLSASGLAATAGVRHGFFTREGGVSSDIYASLNVGLGSRDARADVIENRARVAAALGFPGQPVLTAHQIHSALALVVEAPFEGELPRVDALVTRTPGLIVGALAADCCPVLFADSEAGVVAAAHAGWRGALAGVVAATVVAMEGIGANRRRIVAAIGPTISQEAYEVGPEFEQEVVATAPEAAGLFRRTDAATRPHFDLPGFVAQRLQAAGIASIESLNACTYTQEHRFYSYRRATHRGEPDYGRQISAIVVA